MAAEEWVERINTIIDSVRSDLSASHTLSALADRANSSSHNFHRRFVEVAGETPAQFVKRSRLERAAYLMMAAPERMLTDIAFEVGFSDQSDFSRSFRTQYGLAPSKWDRRAGAILPSPLRNPEVRIVSRPALTLATVRIKGVFGLDDLTAGYDELLVWMHERDLSPDRTSLVGMSFDNYRTTPRDRIHYSFGFEVPENTSPSGPVHLRQLPAFTAAAVSVDGELSDIAGAWDLLYDKWFPERPWTPSSLPGLKLFRKRPDQIGWDHFSLDCAVPFRGRP